MICNYENIYDLCLNKYLYQYAYTAQNNNIAVAYSDTDGAVYRTDKTDGTTILITSSSNNTIEPCSLDDDEILASNWECYMIYRDSGRFISNPSIESYKKTQTEIINKLYNSSLSYGILVSIDDFLMSENNNIAGSSSGSGCNSNGWERRRKRIIYEESS